MLEVTVKPTGHCGRTTTGSGRNSNAAVSGVTSEAFARWLTVDVPPLNCRAVGGSIPFRRAMPCQTSRAAAACSCTYRLLDWPLRRQLPADEELELR